MEEVKTIDSKVCKELYVILNKLNLFYKLPEDLQQYISNNQDALYKYDFNTDVPLIYQIENENTKELISYIYLKYINTNMQEKDMLLNKYEQNEQVHNKELAEKYNPENIFRKDNIYNENKLVISNDKKSLFSKILDRIKRIFHIK